MSWREAHLSVLELLMKPFGPGVLNRLLSRSVRTGRSTEKPQPFRSLGVGRLPQGDPGGESGGGISGSRPDADKGNQEAEVQDVALLLSREVWAVAQDLEMGAFSERQWNKSGEDDTVVSENMAVGF